MKVFERNFRNALEYDWRWRIANPTELSAPVDKEDAAIIILTETCGEMTEICGGEGDFLRGELFHYLLVAFMEIDAFLYGTTGEADALEGIPEARGFG